MQSAYAPSSNVSWLKESATIAVSQRAKALRAAGREIIDLGAGEPDFPTPAFIRRAAAEAVERGATKYTATEGILPLREAIAARANAAAGGSTPVDPAEIVVSNGSKQAIFNACFVLFGPGDEVLVPTPSWTSYYEIVSLSRATARPVFGDPARGFKVDADDLERASTARTRGIMLNSPCNPTGAIYSRDEMVAILDLAARRGWWVLSDEIYVRIAYDEVAPGALDIVSDRERLIVIDGVAKAYAMTGWRIGWSIAPRPVARMMAALQSHTTFNPAAVSQHAALAALTNTPEAEREIACMVEEFRRRRDAALELLEREGGPPALRPDGAFYLYLDASAAEAGGDAGTRLATHLLDAHGVAVVPGAAFLTPDWVRVSYAAPYEQVLEGIRRVSAAYRELAEGRLARA